MRRAGRMAASEGAILMIDTRLFVLVTWVGRLGELKLKHVFSVENIQHN